MVKICPKGLSAWASLLGKKGTCLETLEVCRATNEGLELFNMLPRDALPSVMVWNAGGGQQWAATAVK
jgi:hypothetical protein